MTDLTLLIADDETIERNTMSQFIRENFPQIDHVEVAENGFELVEKAERLHPDIMFVDVEMPGMSGLDGIGVLRKKGITSRIIIYSAYSQFEYAQEAIFLDVSAYLLKPARRADLVKSINEAIEQVIEDRKVLAATSSNEQIVSRISPLLQTEFIRSIILNDLDGETMAVCLHLLALPFSNGCMVTLALDDGHISSTKVRTLIQERIPFQAGCAVGPLLHGRCSLYLYFEGVDGDEDLLTKCRAWSASVTRQFKTLHAIGVEAGIGLPCRRLSDILASYQQSVSELQPALGQAPTVHDLFLRNRDRFQDLLWEGDEGRITTFIQRLFGELTQSNATPNSCRHMVGDFLLRSWQEIKLKTGTDKTIRDLVGFSPETLDQQSTLGALMNWTLSGVRQILAFVNAEQLASGLGYVAAARGYINEHYMDAISLDKVADHIGISPYYLSHLFKQEMDMTFLQYVTKYRMYQANLLHRNGLALDQVAPRVGYQNGSYFKKLYSQSQMSNKAP